MADKVHMYSKNMLKLCSVFTTEEGMNTVPLLQIRFLWFNHNSKMNINEKGWNGK